MPTAIRSYAKINIGLRIGARRPDGFHDLRTMYTTLALHERVALEVAEGEGITIQCGDPRVPCDATNTAYRAADLTLQALGVRKKVSIAIHKQFPVQGGLGAASGNAVAAMLCLEKALGLQLSAKQRWDIAARIGSDLNLFLYGGLTLGTGRGEEVWPLPDLPSIPVVIVTPELGVSTPQAFKSWDSLTHPEASATISEFNHLVYEWLSTTGVPASGGDRAETLLLDLVRTGISNDFERVVFAEIPELREVKRALERYGACYASLSGSGSTLYGLFRSSDEASAAAASFNAAGMKAIATRTLPREQYWQEMFD
jgi:4-diphosphocytidyl-2-C-methyl-D-erythritol kinase